MYYLSENLLNQYKLETSTFEQKSLAISMIDDILSVDNTVFSKVIKNNYIITGVYNPSTNIITYSNLNFEDDAFKYCFATDEYANEAEIESSNITQIKLKDDSQKLNQISTTFFVYQKYKMPFLPDSRINNNKYYKKLNSDVLLATILQLQHIVQNDLTNNTLVINSENSSSSSISESYETNYKNKMNILYSTQAIEKIKNYI